MRRSDDWRATLGVIKAPRERRAAGRMRERQRTGRPAEAVAQQLLEKSMLSLRSNGRALGEADLHIDPPPDRGRTTSGDCRETTREAVAGESARSTIGGTTI
jgi:hypothetical protein